MWSFNAPIAVIGLVAIAELPLATAKPYPVPTDWPRDVHNATQLERRDCGSGGTQCGWYGQLCCYNGQQCITDSNNQAQCSGAAATGWVTYTTTWVETVGLVTKTSVWSSFVGATAVATPTGTSCTNIESPCGSTCCPGGYYCFAPDTGSCSLIGGSSSPGVTGTVTPSAPLRPTSSTLIVITATGSPTATVPFETPIATGVNGTLVPVPAGGGGGLSGGAIAGIVIGSILGALLLLLICLYCCARAIFDTILACFGLGRKNRRHTHEETYIEEHHHSHGSAAAAGGRRWYGQPSRPNRPPKKSGGFGNALGIGAALGGLALALGMKRKHDRKHDDKSTTISGSSAYYSDYTSSSSASSSDRRSRPTRHSSRH